MYKGTQDACLRSQLCRNDRVLLIGAMLGFEEALPETRARNVMGKYGG